MSSLPMLFPDALRGDMVPATVFAGGRVRSPAQITVTGSYPFVNWNTTYDVNANVTRMMGSHAVKRGVYYQRSLKNSPAFIPFNGVVALNNDANNPFDSTHPYANAALGIYTTFTQASGYAVAEWRYTNVEWYLQDTWRVFDDVTLDGGVRFYYLTPQWDVSQQAANVLPEQYDPSQTVRLFRPAIVNGVLRGYDAPTGRSVAAPLIGRVLPNSGDPFNGTFQAGQGIDETLSAGARFMASPRVGVAWDIGGRQVLVARGALGYLANDWQISGNYRWVSGAPYPITFSIPGVTSLNLTGSDQPARVVLVGDPGLGWSSDPYRQINAAAFAPPQPGSVGMESPRYFVYGAPINNLDVSIAKSFPLGGRRLIEIRLDAFNALNTVQFSGVNNQVAFRSLTDPTITNLPYDANGNLVNMNGIGTVSAVRPARELQAMARIRF